MTKDSLESKIIQSYYQGSLDDLTPKLRDEFFRWLADNQGEQEKQRIIIELWEQEKGDPDGSLDRVLAELEQRGGFDFGALKKKRSISLRRRLLRVAAVVIPFLLLAGGWLVLQKETVPTTHENYFAEDIVPTTHENYFAEDIVPYGQTRHVYLPDSTKVFCNAGTKFAVNYNDSIREIRLTGEAYFDVTRDEGRPFVVRLGELEVTVLGTEFNVEAYPDRNAMIVTLKRGSVNVTTPDLKSYTLEPNKQLAYSISEKNIEIITVKNMDEALGWMSGAIVFKINTLQEMFNAIERKFDIKVEVDPSVNVTDMRYTTQFGAKDSVQTIMQTLKLFTDKFDYRVEGENVRVIGRK